MRAQWLAPGLQYFGLVFGAGFVLGIFRELLVTPSLGASTAELLEMPLMLLVILFSARFLVQRYSFDSSRLWLKAGLAALIFLMTAELSLVLWLRNISLVSYLESKVNLSGLVYGLSLIFYGLAPCLWYFYFDRNRDRA